MSATATLANKVVLVTNAATSLGYHIGQRLCAAGAAKLYMADGDKEKLETIVRGIAASAKTAKTTTLVEAVHSSMGVGEQRKELFQRIASESGRLDVAVLAAEPNPVHGDIVNASSDEFDSTFSRYLSTPFFTCQAALPLLEKSQSTGGASVILFTSMAGYTPFIDVGLFSAAQTAQLGLCKALAQSLARRRVRVNSVCLGMFADDGSSAGWSRCSPTRQRDPNEVEGVQRELAALIPVGRVATSEDCVGLVAFLASDASSYITGENVALTGGVSVRI